MCRAMKRIENQMRLEEPDNDSSGYVSTPQQPSSFHEGEQGGQQDGYQQYNQPYRDYQPHWQGQTQRRQQYWYRQPYGAPPCFDVGPYELTSLGIRARTAGWLCYLLVWISGLIFFLLERGNRFVRFHATQSILFFGAMSILEAIVRSLEVLFSYSYIPIFGLGVISGALLLVTLVCWIGLMVSAAKGRYYKLPVIGDFAEKIANQVSL